MDWYKRWIGDYRRDTARLSATEHGVYALLLDEQYATEDGLPPGLPELYRICHATSRYERSAVKKVASLFFPIVSSGKRFNKRAWHEIEKVNIAKIQAVEAGKKGAERRWGHRDPTGDPIYKNGDPNGVGHQNPTHSRMALQTLKTPDLKNSVVPERLNPAAAPTASTGSGRSDKQEPKADPEPDRVQRAVMLLSADPRCTEHEAARLCRVSVEAIREARRT